MAFLAPAAAGAAGAGAAGSLMSGIGSGVGSGLAGMLPSLLGGGGGQSSAPQIVPLQHSQGQPVIPTTVPSVGNSGPLSGGSGAGLNPQLMKLIQMLSGGGGGIS